MENTNTQAETISQDLLANIFKEYEAPAQEATPPTIENVDLPATPPEQQTEVASSVEAPKVEQPTVVTDYSKKLKSAIQDGFIENFAITYEGEEVFLDDISDLNEEAYTEILKAWKTEKDNQIKEKYISKEGLDDNTKKLIEIKKAGGDITEIIRENVTAIDQLTQLKENIDNEKVQINIVGKDLEQRGISLNVIQAQIKDLIERGDLESEATKILDSHLTIHNDAIETKRQSELQRVDKEKEDLKTLRKTLTSTYKELGIPDNQSKIFVDNVTKLDTDKISNTDKLYFEAVSGKDPQALAELNYFLNDREGYKKWVSSKKVLETKLDETKKLLSININKQKKVELSKTSLEDYADQLINNTN